MLTKIKHPIFSFLTISLLFSACGGSDEPATPEIRLESPAVFNCITSGSSSSLVASGGYTILTHEASKTADLLIKGFTFGSDAGRTYKITNVPLTYKTEGTVTTYTVSASSATSDDGTFTLTNLYSSYTRGITDDEESLNRMTLSYRSGSSAVLMIPRQISASGRTVTTNNGNGSSHESTRMRYRIELREGSTKADLYVANADFMAGMPALGEMKFGDVDLTFNDRGFELTSSSLVPSIDGVPSPNRPVTNLKGQVDLTGKIHIEFNCMRVFLVDATLEGNLFSDPK